MDENEENTGNVESVEKSVKVINPLNEKENFTVSGTEEELEKFKQFFNKTKEVARKNAELEQNKEAPTYQGAPLNEQQVYGSKLPLDQNDTSLPVDMESFSDEYSLVSSLEQQADKGSLEAKKALSQLYSKATEKSWAYDYEGDPKDLYKKLPKNATEKERQELNDKRRLWTRVK
jgi:hypothetical protein